MTYHLLDTDCLIDFLKGITSTITCVQNLNSQGHTLATSDVVVGEVFSGLLPQDRAAGERLLDSLFYLPTSRQAAIQAGDWRYVFARQGKTLALTDTLIAATALQHGAAVVTGNVTDYPMQEVAVVPLPRAAGQRQS